MKRKLVDIDQPYKVVCDGEFCDFAIPNPDGDPNRDTEYLVDVDCPECGANLLTRHDHDVYVKFMKKINWANKWFSWLKYIPWPFKADGGKDAKIEFHRGGKITVEK